MASSVAGRVLPLLARVRIVVAALALLAVVCAVAIATNSNGVSPITLPAQQASLPAAAAAATPAARGSLSPDLARLAAAHPQRPVEAIVQLTRGVDAARGRALVRALGGQPGLDLHIINGLSARLSAGAAQQLAASPLVRAVSLNAPIKEESSLVAFNPNQMGTIFDTSTLVKNLWNFTTGQGVGVAVIDTGVTGNLPDFRNAQGSTSSRVVASAVIDPGASTAADTFGHGTMVGGLIAGNGGYRDAGDPVWGQYAGTAPDANLISVKISDDNNVATTLDAIYGLQFAVDNKSAYNIRVVNMSFRSTTAQSYTTDPLDAAAEAAWNAGIVVVAAAGNRGTQADAVSYAPGNDPYVITVGAVDEQGTKSLSNDIEPSWSSQGVTQDGFAKPDVLAPGAHIVSTLAPGSAFTTLCPTCIVGGTYFQASGTSLAAPIVSGIVADLVALHPDWTPSMVKGAIVSTTQQLPGGGGMVNAWAADGASGAQLVSDQGLTPNTLIDPNSGGINYNAASWSAASWSGAALPLTASWSTASWSCGSCTSGSAAVSPTTASWSTLGWATFWG
jgi:serine protease AprX